MLSSLSAELENRPEDVGCCTGRTAVEDTEPLGSLLVSAVTESQQEDCETSPALQTLLDYLVRSSAEHISMLARNPQFQHYLHRLVRSEVKYSRDENVAKLAVHFPDAVAHFLSSSMCDGSIHETPTTVRESKPCVHVHKRAATEGDIASIYEYNPADLPVTFRGSQVKLSDLSSAIHTVSKEVREKQKSRSGFNAMSAAKAAPVSTASISRCIMRRKTCSTKRNKLISRAVSEKPQLYPVFMKDVNDSHFMTSKSGHSLFPKKKAIRRSFEITPVYLHGQPLHSAQDVIEAFASGMLKSESEFVYLNYKYPDKWCPYDLTVVPKTKIQSEHFVMTKFGIILVTPDETSTIQTFSEWLKEASLFTLIRQITFFKEYKIRRALMQWYQAVRQLKFRRLCAKVNRVAIRFLPTYSDALLQLKKLSDELLTISFHNLKPLGEYKLEELELSLRRSQTKARQFLNRYFKYSRRVVSGAIETTCSHALKLEMEHRHQPFVSDLPISIQQKNHKTLKKNLEAAIYHRDKLGCFVDLAEQMVCSCLIRLTQQVVGSWKEILLCKDSVLCQASSGFQIPLTLTVISSVEDKPESNGYFLFSSMVFNDMGELTLKPSSSCFDDLFSGFYHNVLAIISSAVYPLDRPANKRSLSSNTKDTWEVSSRPTTTEPSPDGFQVSYKMSSDLLTEHGSNPQKFKGCSLPPSLSPSKQPVKSLLRALRGIPQEDVVHFFKGGGDMLPSQEARSRLTMTDIVESIATTETVLKRCSPLDRLNFLRTLRNDKHTTSLLKEVVQLADKVYRNLESIVQDYCWLGDVWAFIQTWEGFRHNDIVKVELVQDILQQLHGWYNQFQALPSKLVGPYSVICVSSSELVDLVLPKLLSVQEQIQSEIMKKARALCVTLLKEIKDKSEILSSKRYDLEGFSEYAHTLRQSTKFWSDQSDNVIYVKKMYGTLHQLGVQVPQQDKEMGKELQSEWQNFKVIMAEAKDFVAKQTPIKAQGLQESINSCEEEILALVEQVNRGKFVDPHQSPSELLDKLAKMRQEVSMIHSRLLGLSKWKDDITGFPHDLSPIQNLLDQLYYRQELWKYRRVFDRHENEWKNSPFKKLDIDYIAEKVTEWLGVSCELEKVLPEEDPVLMKWTDRLHSLQKSIPLLLQLASKNLKMNHWITVFAALGEEYDPNKEYTLTDFSFLNIYDHSAIIFEICHDAMQQENLKNQIHGMMDTLEACILSVIPSLLECCPLALPKKVDSSEEQTTTKKSGTDKTTSFALDVIKSSSDDSSQKLYQVMNLLEISIDLEHHLAHLKMLLVSSHLGNLKTKGEVLLETLLQLLEIVNMLTECQTKWDRLLRLFESVEEGLREDFGLTDLQEVTIKYQEIARSIHDDPRLLSLLDKKHGQKGFREFQGETLRRTCKSILNSISAVEFKVEDLVKEGCQNFPRLCSLPTKDIISAVCNRGDPLSMIPIINKVFPAIKTLRFSKSAPSSKALNFAQSNSNDSEGFQIVSVKGWFDETLSLSVPLPLGKKPGTQWLSALEYAISHSLGSALNETYSSLPDLLKGMKTIDESKMEELVYWLDGHLSQCVLIAMELHWTQTIYEALASPKPIEQLKQKGIKVYSAVNYVSEVLLKWRDMWSHPTDLLLQHLTLLLRQKSGMIQTLISEQTCSLESFHWRSQLLYSTDEAKYLYSADKDNINPKTKVGPSDGQRSSISTRSESRQSLFALRKMATSSSLVSSSKSLLSNSLAVCSSTNLSIGNKFSKLNASSIISQKAGFYPPLRTFVHCYESSLSYSFEFLGAGAHLCHNPQTEASLLSLVQAMGNHVSPLINTPHTSSSVTVTGKDLSVALGTHFYAVDCSLLSESAVLHRLLCSSVRAGSILQLDNFHCLPLLLQVSLGQWLSTLACSMLENIQQSSTTVLQSEDPRTSSVPSPISTKEASSSRHDLGPMSSQPSRQQLVSPQWSNDRPQHSGIRTRSYDPTPHKSSSRTITRMDWYQSITRVDKTETGGFGYGGGTAKRLVEVNGKLLTVSPAFGCIFVGDVSTQPIPEQLKTLLRPIAVQQPDLSYLAESLLASYGFTGSNALGRLLSQFQQQLKHQLSSCNPVISSCLGASTLKRIISHAATLLMDDKNHGPQDESKAITNSVLHLFGPQLASDATDKEGGEEEEEEEEEDDENQIIKGSSYVDLAGWTKLRELLESYFHSDNSEVSSSFSFPTELGTAVKAQLKERHLQCLPGLLQKIQQLHLSLVHSKCVYLTGPCGSGKTTCYSILNAAYEHVRTLHALSKYSSHSEMKDKKGKMYPFVNINVFNPRVYSLDELFGCYGSQPVEKGNHRAWKDGILTSAIRRIESYNNALLTCSHPDGNESPHYSSSDGVMNWLVLDGPIEPALNRAICHLIAEGGMTLGNGERLSLPPPCKLIVETLTLDHVTPSLQWSSVVHCSRETMSSGALINTWLDRAPTQHNLSSTCTETLAVMIHQLLPDTLAYLINTNTQHYGAEYKVWRNSQVHGMAETQCFLSLLSAVLERNAPKEEASWSRSGTSRSSRATSQTCSRSNSMIFSHSMTSIHVDDGPSSRTNLFFTEEDIVSGISNLDTNFTLSLRVQIASMLSFAYIWSLGAFVPFSEVQSFSELARDLIMQLPYAVPLPDEGSVFDYYLDLNMYRFIPWAESTVRGVRDLGSGYIALPELSRFAYIADLYLSYGFNIIFVGDTGAGKTSFVNSLMKRCVSLTRLAITQTLTPSQLHSKILNKLAQQTKLHGQRITLSRKSTTMRVGLYLDDLHLAHPGNQPSLSIGSPILEAIHYLLYHRKIADPMRSWYEKNLSFKYLASCTPDGYWRLPARLTRSMCLLPFLPLSDECLHQVFSQSLQQWLTSFSPSVLGKAKQIANALSAASVTVYRSVAARFRSSSSRPHYLINLHDLINVYEGLLLLSPDTKAQTQPQFSLLNRRGFQSSNYSSSSSSKLSTSRRKSSVKLKSGRKGLQRQSSTTNVIKGVTAKKSKDESDPEEMISTLRMVIRVWCHESTRVYLDRSTESRDHLWFLKLLESCIKHCFCGIGLGGNLPPKDPFASKQALGLTTGGRRVRGTRVRGGTGGVGNTRSQGSLSSDGLNEEELAGAGVKVDTLKTLMKVSAQAEQDEVDDDHDSEDLPLKLISIDQVTVRGEDLTGLIFAQFPDPCSPASSPEPEESCEDSLSGSESSSSTTSAGNTGLPKTPARELTLRHPYSELGDGQVMEILSKHLEHFQKFCNKDVDVVYSSYSSVVLYREAIEHCARLYRVMNLPGAHALLLGMIGLGRKSLIRLMSYIMQSNMMDVDKSCAQVSLKKCLRDACLSASMDNRNTILVISDCCPISFAEWEQVIELMNEGLADGLFTTSEILMMSSKLDTGRIKRNTVQAATQAFSRAVRTQLHVLVLWNVDSVTGSLFARRPPCEGTCHLVHEASVRNLFRSLNKSCSYIDQYKSWSKGAYSEIAIMWWQRDSSAVQWQDWADTSSQLEAIGSLAAHIHITTTELLGKAYGSLARHLVSPRILIECLTMTQHIAIKIKDKEKTIVSKLQSALSKLEDVDKVVFELECKIAKLKSNLAAAEVEVHQKMRLITTAKERYMDANKHCKIAEETIEYETTNVQNLAAQVEHKFSQVSGVYHGALEALSSVDQKDILELMSYRKPPAVLSPIFNALCMIFDRNEDWEDCKILLMSHKFVDSLKFFDRDHVPRNKLRRLEEMVYSIVPSDVLQTGSKAVMSISKWLNALVDYHKIMKSMDPIRKQLKDAESTLTDANLVFATMKRDMIVTKAALEDAVKLHKESVKKSRAIEAQIDALKKKLGEANHILTTMAEQRKRWKEKLQVSCSHLDSVPGHAMLCAAGACYLSRIPLYLHKELQANWLGYCSGTISLGSVSQDRGKLQAAQAYGAYSGQKQVVRVQKDFSIANHFSDREERSLWEQESSFPDETIMERCLCTRALSNLCTSFWPLVFDPYRQFEVYLRALNICHMDDGMKEDNTDEVFEPVQKCDILLVDSSDDSLYEVLKEAVAEGRTVLLSIDLDKTTANINQTMESAGEEHSSEHKKFLSQLLQKNLENFTPTTNNNNSCKYNSKSCATCSFQLYLVVYQSIREVLTPRGLSVLGSTLSDLGMRRVFDGSVVDLELMREALESHLLRLVTNQDRPEFHIRHKSLLTDLVLHRQQIEEKEDEMLEAILDPKNQSLLYADELLSFLREKESSEVVALDQIKETSKNLQVFDKQIRMYQPLTKFASAVLCSLQKLSSAFQYFSSSIQEFEQVLATLIVRFKSNKPPNHAMSINARVLHLKNQLLLSVYQHFQAHVFERHQLLIPLLVELELELEKGKVDIKEVELLCRNLGGLAAQLECVEVEEKDIVLHKKPHWVTDESWCMAMELQKEIPALQRLMIEVVSNSSEWEEYFKMACSTMVTVPSFGTRCLLSQKLLLWKAFRPDKLHALAKDGVLITAGADFIRTKSPSLDEIMELTGPSAVTLLLLPQSPSSAPSLESIKDAGLRLQVNVKHFSLDMQATCDEMIADLALVACESCWLVVEYCHLMDNFPEVLADMNKKLTDIEVHPNFRVMVLIPVGHVGKHSSISKCYKVIFQAPEVSDTTELSQFLLQDLSKFIACSSNSSNFNLLYQASSWAGCEPVLARLQAFLPQPLTDSELKALDLRQQHQDNYEESASIQQGLQYLIYEELCLHDQAVISLHASLALLLGFLRGTVMFSPDIGLTLYYLCANKIPQQWHAHLPRPLGHVTGLVSAVKLLRSHLALYKTTLQSGSLPSKLHPLLLSNPEELFSRQASCFATSCQVERHAVIAEAELIETDSSGLQPPEGTTPGDSIVLHSLTLHNASWDHTHKCLLPLRQPPDSTHNFSAVVGFKVGEYHDYFSDSKPSEPNTYNCPVLLGPNMSRNQPTAILFHLPFAYSWSEEVEMTGVYLSCNIHNNQL